MISDNRPFPWIRWFVALFILGAASFATLYPRSPKAWRFSGDTMGTRYNVRVVRTETARRADIAAGIEARLTRANRLWSTYDQASLLSQINRAPPGTEIALDEESFALLRTAGEIFRASDGAFDPTVAPLVDAWGFGPAGPTPSPKDDALKALQPVVGWHHIELRDAPPRLEKLRAGVRLDLSAIAKGQAAADIATWLRTTGSPNHMVEIGGEVCAGGKSPQGTAWRIGIQHPDQPGAHGVLHISDRCVATSGNYRNFRWDGSVRLGHTISPGEGRPAQSTAESVTVVHTDGAAADAWATALLASGSALPSLARKNHLDVLVLRRGPKDTVIPEVYGALSYEALDTAAPSEH